MSPKEQSPLPGSLGRPSEKQLAAAMSNLTPEQQETLGHTVNETLGKSQGPSKYHIPDDMVQEVGKWLQTYHKKHPGMSKQRVMRKAAEHFKLKEVEYAVN